MSYSMDDLKKWFYPDEVKFKRVKYAWQCDVWQGCYRYGARGKTKYIALLATVHLKESGKVIEIDHLRQVK